MADCAGGPVACAVLDFTSADAAQQLLVGKTISVTTSKKDSSPLNTSSLDMKVLQLGVAVSSNLSQIEPQA